MFPKSGSGKKQRGQGTVSVGSLFEKYKKTLRAPQKSVTNAFITAVKETIPHVHLEPHHCDYTPHTHTLVVRVQGPFKTEIMLNREKILERMTATLGEQNVPRDII